MLNVYFCALLYYRFCIHSYFISLIHKFYEGWRWGKKSANWIVGINLNTTLYNQEFLLICIVNWLLCIILSISWFITLTITHKYILQVIPNTRIIIVLPTLNFGSGVILCYLRVKCFLLSTFPRLRHSVSE